MSLLSRLQAAGHSKVAAELKDRNILITGASSGIGKEVLDRLAEPARRNRILATSRTIEKLTGYGDNVTLYNCDVSTKEGVDRMFEKAETLFDRIDIVIANAGAPYYEQYDYVDWDRIGNIFNLNTISPIYTYTKYLRHLDGREGHIAFTISVMGEMAMPGYALYTATKFAMKGFQEAIRLEAPENLRITAIYPVATATNFFNVGGNGIDVGKPQPVQSAAKVAEALISGLAEGREHIYPYRMFKASKLLMDSVPPLKRAYWEGEKRRLSKFIARKAELSRNGEYTGKV